MHFYALPPLDQSVLQQGDLLENVPFSIFSIGNVAVRLGNEEIVTLDLTKNNENVRFLTAAVEFSWGMILSQTCDLQPNPQTGYARKPILISRVRPIKEIFTDFKDTTYKESVTSIKSYSTPGKSPNVLYLPEQTLQGLVFPKSGADLSDLQRFPKQDLKALSSLLKLRLQDTALQALQERCAYCFGRFGAPDNLYYSEDNLYYSEEEWAFDEERRKTPK